MLTSILSAIATVTFLQNVILPDESYVANDSVGKETLIAQAQEPSPVRQLGYIVEFEDCTRIADEQVECSFLVQNQNDSRKVLQIRDTNLFDSEGKTTSASSSIFSGQDYYSMTLPSGVPVKGIATFDGIRRNAGLVFMEINFYSATDNEWFVAEFML